MIELIETLWNVNEGHNFWFCKMGAELIETLWNVNIINCCFKTYGGTN